MTKEMFDKIIARAKGCPCMLVGDNMLLFYVNFDQHYYTQDADFVYCIRTNAQPAGTTINQKKFPYEIIALCYEQIQYIKVFPNREVLEAFIDGMDTVITGETIADIKKEILSSKLLSVSSPKGNDEYAHEAMGNFPGLTVTLGTELDPYTKKAMDRENQDGNHGDL